jgi:hypothetical protein
MNKRHKPGRPTLGLLLTLLCLGAGPVWADKAVPLDPRQAAALWQDGRWLAFQAAMKSGLNMRCEIPPASATLAREITHQPPTDARSASAPASSDWRSRHHEMLLPCTGQQGLRALRIRAEYLPAVSEPLNLELGLLFER